MQLPERLLTSSSARGYTGGASGSLVTGVCIQEDQSLRSQPTQKTTSSMQ